MRTIGEVRQKFKQARYRHFKKLLLASLPSEGDWDPDEAALKKEEVAKILSQPTHILAQRFPDLAALLWVLGEDSGSPFVPGATLVGSLDGVLLWADTEDEAAHVRDLLNSLAATHKRSWWRALFS